MGFMWQSDHRLRPLRMVWGGPNYDSRIWLSKLLRPRKPVPRLEFKPEPKIGINRLPYARNVRPMRTLRQVIASLPAAERAKVHARSREIILRQERKLKRPPGGKRPELVRR